MSKSQFDRRQQETRTESKDSREALGKKRSELEDSAEQQPGAEQPRPLTERPDDPPRPRR